MPIEKNMNGYLIEQIFNGAKYGLIAAAFIVPILGLFAIAIR